MGEEALKCYLSLSPIYHSALLCDVILVFGGHKIFDGVVSLERDLYLHFATYVLGGFA